LTAVVVTGLAITPVKGTRLQAVGRVALALDGVRENRRFFVIDARDQMVNGKVLGELQTVIADYADCERRLTLTLPDGRVVSDAVTLGERVEARFFSRTLLGRLGSRHGHDRRADARDPAQLPDRGAQHRAAPVRDLRPAGARRSDRRR
jgi:uncharacterized protein YcbX